MLCTCLLYTSDRSRVVQDFCAEAHVRFESIHKPRRAAWVVLLTGLFACPLAASADLISKLPQQAHAVS